MRGQHSTPLGAAEVSARGEVHSDDEGSEYAPSGRYVCRRMCDNPSKVHCICVVSHLLSGQILKQNELATCRISNSCGHQVTEMEIAFAGSPE